jgi:hypothetical protein
MTPVELVTLVRQQWNAVGDDFFADTELYSYIQAAEMDLARQALVIEQNYSTSTVASQQTYAFPTNAIAIKRITYAGNKLMPINFREDDTLTLNNATTTATGTPQYYALWERTIYLRPIPSDVGTLVIYSYDAPAAVSANSVLEIPTCFHFDVAEYVLWRMAAKDKNFEAAEYYRTRWQDCVMRARAWQRRSKRADGFTNVQDIDILPLTVIGAV